MLEELSLPYQVHMLPFPPRGLARDYLTINPLGTVPLLLDGDVRLTESAAICEYLVRRYGNGQLDVLPDDPEFGRYLNWLHMSDATLTFPQTLVLRYRFFETAERLQPQVAEDYQRWFLARLKAVDHGFTYAQFLCGERFTVADVAVTYALQLATHLGMESKFPPGAAAYWQRMQQRPTFMNALKIEEQAALKQGVSPTPSPQIRP
jgi:glutathione S-transferase